MKVTIIGSGIFALAIAKNLKNSVSLLVWTHDESEKEKEEWQNYTLTTNYKEAIDFSDHIFFLVSSTYMEHMLQELKNFDAQNKTIYIGTKGLLNHEPYYYFEYIKENIPVKNVAAFAGPNLAQDMILKNPTSITFSYLNEVQDSILSSILESKIRFTENLEIKETSLASVLKNIYAIGSGILWEGTESKSTMISYLSNAYKELKKCIPNPSVDILGDFFLTGIMLESRNFTYGRLLKRKENTKEYLKTHTVEGVSMISLLKEKRPQNLPILNTIISIVLEKKEPNALETILFSKDR